MKVRVFVLSSVCVRTTMRLPVCRFNSVTRHRVKKIDDVSAADIAKIRNVRIWICLRLYRKLHEELFFVLVHIELVFVGIQ